MIKELHFKFGARPDHPPVAVEPGPMTVLVGPNNSGKSLTLRELHEMVRRAKSRCEKNLIVEFLGVHFPSEGSIRNLVVEKIQNDLGPIQRAFSSSIEATVATLVPGPQANDLGRLFQILQIVDRVGKLKELSKSDKVNLEAIRASLEAPTRQPDESDIHYLLRLGHSFLDGLQAHVDVLEVLGSPENSGAPAETLVSKGLVRLDGYMDAFRETSTLLDGKGRLGLVDAQRTHALGGRGENLPMAVRSNPEIRRRLRGYVYDAFGSYVSIDVSSMREARFVFSDTAPDAFEDSIGPEALSYYAGARDISDFSDGVKSYVGLHAALLAGDHKLILIDEPEAFLHPPLARRLGFNLTRLAVERKASVVAATHSPAFLMGCVEAGEPLNVVRLGYHGGQGRAQLLPAKQLAEMMSSPLLRSTGVLEALFHQSVIVCEGDSDRAFYQEIYERIHRDRDTSSSGFRAARDCIFLNSHGTGGMPRLLDALHRIGIPTAAIPDLDLLKDRSPSVADLLRAVGADTSEYRSANNERGEKYKAFERVAAAALTVDKTDAEYSKKLKEATSKLIKSGGLRNLTDDKQRRSIQSFLDKLAEYGLFTVPCGELESWLPTLSQGINKQDWVPEVFRKMGSFGESDYLAPSDDDVWAFIRMVTAWLEAQASMPSPPQRQTEEPAAP